MEGAHLASNNNLPQFALSAALALLQFYFRHYNLGSPSVMRSGTCFLTIAAKTPDKFSKTSLLVETPAIWYSYGARLFGNIM